MSYRLLKMIGAFRAIVALAANLLPTGEFAAFLYEIERLAREDRIRVLDVLSKPDREHE